MITGMIQVEKPPHPVVMGVSAVDPPQDGLEALQQPFKNDDVRVDTFVGY
jgi:hypothetical protein